MEKKSNRKPAYIFILVMGMVSLFSDLTHEGARSIYGSYLGFLGASAMVISTVSGLGEFLGQGLRLFTGYITDKTRKYWLFAIIGYSFNIIIIPLFAFVPMNGWLLACFLVVMERVGKAIRAPAKSTLLSFAGNQIGVGKTFAIHEALDQIGAFLGPILLFVIMTLMKGGDQMRTYSVAFLSLGVTALLTVIILLIARKQFPHPDLFEEGNDNKSSLYDNKYFWIYIAAIGFIAAGFIDYPLIAFHIGNRTAIPVNYIPLLYGIAMAADAFAALFFGSLFDKKGIISLMIAVIISSLFGLFIFVGESLTFMVITGVILWGIGMGAQESVLKAVIGKIVAKEKRASAYGLFNAIFGLFWFAGSALIGYIYGFSLWAVAVISLLLQLASLPLLIYLSVHLDNKKRLD